MTGDFNCHSREWDPSVPHHQTMAISLLDIAARLGLELTLPVNPGPTFLSHNVELRGSVIDLVFIKASESLVQPRWLLDLSGRGRRIISHWRLNSHYPQSLKTLRGYLLQRAATRKRSSLNNSSGEFEAFAPTTIAEVDAMAQAVADVFSKAWSDNVTEKRITCRSELWWNDTCSETLLQYWDDKTPKNRSTFRKTTRATKHKFFDAKIEEIAKTN